MSHIFEIVPGVFLNIDSICLIEEVTEETNGVGPISKYSPPHSSAVLVWTSCNSTNNADTYKLKPFVFSGEAGVAMRAILDEWRSR